ncbi:restriction endonuclease subunit S [Streptococcus mitis]|jgi:sty sbli|uniref:HsdS n=1 Tax=Streptococcus mitis TaxID=28037 RepID=A0AAX2L3K0_STRMT|nr:restriction endonuclease subunit S [Streptococcus mitis]MBZ2102885.1 restriction endonuclease subunit S [Streptococcus mitis]OOS17360.1 restriction endonuclease subunit S [Streptococcus mitis]QBZ12207.1 type-1 restriction enzyme MjaXIP specificity domain protein [Streptococcus mitis NCTC 12261]QGS42720.1 restriction endonuclease subunit S [Streptococcus mitis]QXA55366.1 restriction endonuclease subunit S [Streptococcus mitis]
MSEKLSDVVTIISGGTPKTSVKEYWDGDIDWLAVADFNTSNRYVSTASKKITELGLNNSNTKMLEKGDLIISARGTVGAIAQLTKPMAFNQSCFGLRGKKNKLETDYLYYWLKNYVDILLNKSQGSVFNTINLSTFDDIKIDLPNIENQRSISNFLTLLDNKIQINNQINQELEAMAKTLYDYWFVQFDFPDQNGKPYKSSGGKMVYHPELKREIPEGWGVEKLKYFLTIKNGKDHKHLQDGKFAVYGSGGIMRTVADYLYSGESILFPRKGTLNNVMYVNEEFWTVDTMFYSEVNKNNSALYVFYSVKDIDFNKLNTGTGVPSMTSSILYDLNIIVPEENILEKFNTIVKQNYETIKLNNIQNQELNQLRDWLLPMLMNGQVII